MSQKQNSCRSANGSDESLGLLWLRCGVLILVFFYVVLSHFPGFVRVVLVHALERLQRIGAEVFFVHDSVGPNHKRHHSSYPILSRCSRETESTNHCAADHEVHFSQWRVGSLSFQHLEIVTVIGFTSLRGITFLERSRHFFSHRASPCPIRILPCQAVMFPRGTNDALCVLVSFRTVMFFHRVLVLRVNEATTNRNGVQFVRTYAPVQYFLAPDLRIKKPLSIFLHERNRKRKIIVTYQNNGLIRIFLVCLDGHFFFCFGCKFRRTILVLNRVFGCDYILAIRPQNFLRRGSVKIRRDLHKGVGRLFRCVELFLCWLRRGRCAGFRRWCRVQTGA